MKPYIVIIDPQSGIVEALIDLSEIAKNESKDVNAVLNGIAYDARGNKIWITGKHWHHIIRNQLFSKWALGGSPFSSTSCSFKEISIFSV